MDNMRLAELALANCARAAQGLRPAQWAVVGERSITRTPSIWSSGLPLVRANHFCSSHNSGDEGDDEIWTPIDQSMFLSFFAGQRAFIALAFFVKRLIGVSSAQLGANRRGEKGDREMARPIRPLVSLPADWPVRILFARRPRRAKLCERRVVAPKMSAHLLVVAEWRHWSRVETFPQSRAPFVASSQ